MMVTQVLAPGWSFELEREEWRMDRFRKHLCQSVDVYKDVYKDKW